MREIKFNAVDEATCDYVRFDDFVSELEKEYDDTHNEFLAKFLEYYYGYKLLLYTGLKDRNGVEIYEGDIVEYKDYSEYVYKVIFDEKECRFFAIGITKTQSENNLGYKINNRLKVIGNIYENKELLNGKEHLNK